MVAGRGVPEVLRLRLPVGRGVGELVSINPNPGLTRMACGWLGSALEGADPRIRFENHQSPRATRLPRYSLQISQPVSLGRVRLTRRSQSDALGIREALWAGLVLPGGDVTECQGPVELQNNSAIGRPPCSDDRRSAAPGR